MPRARTGRLSRASSCATLAYTHWPSVLSDTPAAWLSYSLMCTTAVTSARSRWASTGRPCDFHEFAAAHDARQLERRERRIDADRDRIDADRDRAQLAAQAVAAVRRRMRLRHRQVMRA